MTIINYKEIIREVQITVRKGKNYGRKIGTVIFERNKRPYLYVEKNFSNAQMFFKPQLREYMWISISALEDIKKLGMLETDKIIYRITGYEKTFFLIFTLKEFIESNKSIDYDDLQKGVLWNNKPRLFGDERTLDKVI